MTDRKFLSFCNIIIRKSNKMKFFIAVCIAFSIYFLLVYIYNSFLIRKLISDATVRLNFDYVIVHMDLKGSPPKLKYLESLLPKFKKYGVNGMLMEYEDMFPYKGKLVNLSAVHCYDELELRSFLNKAHNAGFEIIPLVQTFGHMEHVLKLKEFQHLREHISFPDSICPSKAESIHIVQQMLAQVINFHAEISPLKYIHIGCDEVFHLNTCERCTSRKLSNISLFLEHVNTVANEAKKLSPETTILIWEDMLRKITKAELFKVDYYFDDIEPVYWDYSSNVTLSHVQLYKYHQKFNNIWIASAYKGADGRTASLPDFQNRLDNHLTWMNSIRNYIFGGEKNVFNFKGIILTGWSRYSHMDPLCELFPASWPVLTINLLLIRILKIGFLVQYPNLSNDKYLLKHLEKDLLKELKCRVDVNFNSFESLEALKCSFEGIELHNALRQYQVIRKAIDSYEFYNSRQFYFRSGDLGNLNLFDENKEWCNTTFLEIEALENTFTRTMKNYYEQYVIEEFLDYKIRPIRRDLALLLNTLKTSPYSRSWERRSYEIDTIPDL